MLIIKSPLTLKYNPCLCRSSDYFTKRICANYEFLTAGLTPEDLLHMLSPGPDIYMAQEQLNYFSSDNSEYSRRELKLSLLNNLLNRILVSGTVRMTWQDQVFISALLHQMGITDVRGFMKQVCRMKRETSQLHTLTRTYWERMWQLRRISGLFLRAGKEEEREKEERTKNGESRTEVYRLHQVIFDRLKTGAVYQEIRNFSWNQSLDRYRVSEEEMMISEQAVLAHYILLHKLKNATLLTKQPLSFQRVNRYEMGNEAVIKKGDDKTLRLMLHAALLSLTDRLYALRAEQLMETENAWYEFSGAVYPAAENTWKRFEAYHNMDELRQESLNTCAETISDYREREIQTLRKLFPAQGQSAEDVTGAKERQPASGIPAGKTRGGLTIPEERREPLSLMQYTEPAGESGEGPSQPEDSLKRSLDEINKRNVRIAEQLHSERLSRRETQSRVDIRRAYMDALEALRQPERASERFQTEAIRLRTESEQRQKDTEQIISKETKRIFEALQAYREMPQAALESGLVTADTPESFERDIRFLTAATAGEERSETARLRPLGRTERPMDGDGNRMLWEPPETGTYSPDRDQRRMDTDTALLHRARRVETEQLFQELHRINATMKSLSDHTTQDGVIHRTEEIRSENVTNRVTEDRREEIAIQVNRSLQQQLDMLTDRIYRRFERKLDGQRRRRGMSG